MCIRDRRISFDGLNWWISVCVEFPDCRETLNDDGVGIDLGIKDLAICSDGTKYKNINKSQKVKKLEKQKRRLQPVSYTHLDVYKRQAY